MIQIATSAAGNPQIVFCYDNGWCASIILGQRGVIGDCWSFPNDATAGSVTPATLPIRGPSEAGPEEITAWLVEVALRADTPERVKEVHG